MSWLLGASAPHGPASYCLPGGLFRPLPPMPWRLALPGFPCPSPRASYSLGGTALCWWGLMQGGLGLGMHPTASWAEAW